VDFATGENPVSSLRIFIALAEQNSIGFVPDDER
jgi:hypothetical protein